MRHECNECKTAPYYPNRDDWEEGFWKNRYKVFLTAQGIKFRVNADNEQEALDYVIDFCEEHEFYGLVMSIADMRDKMDFTEAEIEKHEYYCGGNSSLYLTTHNIYIEEVKP